MPSTSSRRNRTNFPLLIILGFLLFSFLSGQALPVPPVSSEARQQGDVTAAKENQDPAAPVVIRQLTLPARDLIYDPGSQRIYASVPSSAGSGGNSITPIDPVAGTIGNPVFIGSEPNKLAISDNFQYIYASLDGAASVRRFDIASQTAGLQFSLGGSPFSGPYYVEDMAVVPGDPNAVAISRRNTGFSPRHEGVAVYDNGIPRSTATGSHTGSNVIEFSSAPTILYGYNNETTEFGFRTMSVAPTGVSVTSVISNAISGFNVDIRHDNELIYASNGQVIDPQKSSQAGVFVDVGFFPIVLPDSSKNRVYFLSGFGSSTVTLKEYNQTTFMQTGSLTIDGIVGNPGSLIKWGSNGLAFRTTGGQVFLVPTSLIVPIDPTPTPSPVQVASGVVRLPLITNDLTYDRVSQKVYASLPSASGTFGNSIVPIDPETGIMGTPTFVGSEPFTLAISDNNKYIYVAIDGAGSVRKFDIATQSAGILFSIGSRLGIGGTGFFYAEDIVVLPDNPNTIAVSRSNIGFSPRHEGVAIFDEGVARSVTTPNHTGSNVIEPSLNAATLYGYNNETTEFGLRKMAVDASGVTVTSTVSNLLSGFDVDIKHDNGVLYSSSGRAVNPESGTLLGTFSGVNSRAFVPDSGVGRIFFASLSGGSVVIQAFTINTFLPAGSLTIPNVNSNPFNLIRWGVNGLAFSTINGQVYFVQTSLIPTPDEIQFSAANYTTGEGNGHAEVAVTRSTNSTTASVSYSTSDTAGLNNCNVINGIASARCDYSTAVGRLNFAVGESSKTISIPIVDDSYAEGNESFTIALSNASGVTLGAPASATVTINDNEASNGPNPIDGTPFFVRQQYVDFLNREPDPAGFAAWQGVINNCPAGDIACDRIHVSSAFFRSAEFQGRGYFIYRFYPVAFGRKPEYVEFVPDLSKVSGFLSDAELEAAKVAFIAEFMSRPAFAATYNALNNTQYVDTLLATAGVTSPNRDFWIAALGNGTRTRATVLRDIVESIEVYNKYYNEAFVVMQYFGYLRRDPDALYTSWITHLNATGDYRSMINGFMNSLEYRFRFGP